MSDTPEVLFLGGGYLTIYAMKVLRKPIKNGEISATVVDKDNYHNFHGLIPEMLVGRVKPSNIISPSRKLFQPARFIKATIEEIDVENRSVGVRRSLDDRAFELDYDHLVLDIGSVDDLSRYRGIAEHAMKLKDYWDCFHVRNHLFQMMELGEAETDPDLRRRLLTFLVAGGNFAGIEVSSHILTSFRKLARTHYTGIDPDEIRVMVVHSGDRILPELDAKQPGVVDYAEDYLEGIGLEIRRDTKLEAATPEEAVLSTGERIQTETIISCTGTAVSPLLDQLPYDRLDDGRVISNEYGQVEGTETIWAGGDCAAVPDPSGGYCPPLAVYAMTAGKTIGTNVLRYTRDRSMDPYSFPGLGDACVLGGNKAVGHLKGVPFTGFIGWIIWRSFMIFYLPSWDRRIRVVFDWLMELFLGRDIVSMTHDDAIGIESVLYEPGQSIVKQGEVGRSMFLIREGEVEIVYEQPDGEERVGTLGPGDHFGEQAVFKNVNRTATVRATSETRLLRLHREKALQLSETLGPAGESIQQLPDVGATNGQ